MKVASLNQVDLPKRCSSCFSPAVKYVYDAHQDILQT